MFSTSFQVQEEVGQADFDNVLRVLRVQAEDGWAEVDNVHCALCLLYGSSPQRQVNIFKNYAAAGERL